MDKILCFRIALTVLVKTQLGIKQLLILYSTLTFTRLLRLEDFSLVYMLISAQLPRYHCGENNIILEIWWVALPVCFSQSISTPFKMIFSKQEKRLLCF